jgi:predicted RNA binding protein YcfA (HicA-like mRNA interferase family)
VKLPRNVSARHLIKALAAHGYTVTRQKGSHIRLTTQQAGEHHVTVPDDDPIRVGTLSNILRDVAEHFGITRDELLEDVFGQGDP